MKTRHILYLLLAVLLLQAPAYAKRHKKSKKAAAAQMADSAKKQSGIYPKVFKKRDKLVQAHQKELSLFLYNNKVYMEIPVRNFGKEYLISSTVARANIPMLVGSHANGQTMFVADRADTLITFSRPKPNYRVAPGDTTVARAFALAGRGGVFRTAPIAAWKKDSTAVLVEVSSMLSASNKDVLDLKGTSYELGTSIIGCSVKSNLSYWDTVQAYPRCVCVVQEVNGKLSLGGSLIGELSNKPTLQATLQTQITLLPDAGERMEPREANASVGTRYVKYKDYRNLDDTKTGYYVTRRKWAMGDTITYYVDSLLTPSWQAAIRRAAEGWNDAFCKAGLGRPIQLVNFPSDSTFSASDPLLNVISLANNSSQFVGFDIPVDPRTGEILSAHIQVPRSLADDVLRNGVCKMAEVDERYRNYRLPDDLLCEVLQAKMLAAFGYSLGLSSNLAGTAAYSIAQLRSPEFTQKNGITASVMDGQIYNYVALPGDREKGVVLTFDRPGVCDDFVIKYLYTPDVSESTLLSWVKSHEGDPRYFCGKRSMRFATDPRCQAFDMSTDPFQAARHMVQHYKYLALHAPEWLNYDEMSDVDRMLFPEFVINDYFSLLQTLTPYIGGVYQNEYMEGSKVPVTQSVPKSLQRKAVKQLLYELTDVSWLDANPLFFQSAGPSGDVGGWVRRKEFTLQLPMVFRLPYMDMSIDYSSDPYTQRHLIDDVANYCFRSVRAGKRPTSVEIYDMYAFVAYLTASSDVLSEMAKAKLNGATSLSPILGVEPPSEITYYHRTDLGPIVLQKLKEIRPLLVKAKSLAGTLADKNKVQFAILTADRAMKK